LTSPNPSEHSADTGHVDNVGCTSGNPWESVGIWKAYCYTELVGSAHCILEVPSLCVSQDTG